METCVKGVILLVLSYVALSYTSLTVFWRVTLAIVIGYAPSYFSGAEYDGSAYWDWFARLKVWNSILQSFPARLEFEDKQAIDKQTQYLFCSHPHGPISFHHSMYLTNGVGFHEISSGLKRRDLGADVIFRIPIYREWALWVGLVHSGATTVRRMLSQGKSLGILVGGMDEQLIGTYGEHHVFIKERKGFVKIAMEYGVPLVPIYCFGETELYSTSGFALGLRKFLLKRFRMPIPLSWGSKWWCPLVPHKVPLVCCVGRPIPVSRMIEPTLEQLNAKHQEYMDSLISIFERNKERLGYGSKQLHVV